MAINQDKWVMVEQGPLAGLDPETTFHSSLNAAMAAMQQRKDYFERFDIAEVYFRRLVVETVEATELEKD
jgi:hypothetical protein